MAMSDKEFWEAIGIDPPEQLTPTFDDSDDWLKDWPEAKSVPVRTPAVPAKTSNVIANQPQKKNNSYALMKIMAIVIVILGILVSVTAYQNHRLEEAISEASSIIASASLEAESIEDDADEKSSSKIAEAEAKAKKIKEETK